MPDPGRRALNPWPVGIVLGLASVVAVHAVLIYAAFGNRPTLESADYYEQGLAYQAVIDEREASAALDWSVEIEPCAGASASDCSLRITVNDANAESVSGLSGFVVATRADDAAFDREGALEAGAADGYQVRLAIPREGLYRLRVRLVDETRTWVHERRMWLVAGTS